MVLHVASPSGDANGAVDIRIAQRAGEIQVSVHTPDAALQANLRQDLPSLVTALDRAGFDAQTFIPHSSSLTAAVSGSSLGQTSPGGQSSLGESGSGNTADSGSGGAKDSGTPGQFSGQQHSGEQSFSGQHQSRDRQALRWLDQIEE